MYRTLAISALIGSSYAQYDAKEGLDIAKGFMVGAEAAQDNSNTFLCEGDNGKVNEQAEAAVADFKKKDLNDTIAAMQGISKMLDVMNDQKCGSASVDWDVVGDYVKAWHSPLTFAYNSDREISVNGKNIYKHVSKAIQMFDKKKYYSFGAEMGAATQMIYAGKLEYFESIGKPIAPRKDPKIEFAKKNGALFAAGFLFGGRIGGFDETELYACLQDEEDADKIFLESQNDLRVAVTKNDAEMAVQGMYGMLGFIVDMFKETNADENAPRAAKQKEAKCPLFQDKERRISQDGRFMINKLRNDETALKYEDGKYLFNKQDISMEVSWMAELYVKQDFKKLGFLLGDTLDKHLTEAKPSEQQDLLFL